ncbi:hypothetical protein KPH14_000973 [Odynerus spinipes]|uniref:Uncharacterized protein n=1 Tax=Odynerus spinipes TaxID=1348599 RepID=A0AAD9RET8_9HYME|nr:hypothetical protein KPH14_000973 [Odynerus spinipes]
MDEVICCANRLTAKEPHQKERAGTNKGDDVENYGRLEEMLNKIISNQFSEERMREVIRCEIGEEVKKLREEIKQLKYIISELKSEKKEITEGKKNTYADKGKALNNEKIVIIKPSELQESTKTVEEIKNKINVIDLGIGVNKIRNAAKGAIIIVCNNEKDVEKFREVARKKLGDKYKIEIPKKRMPRIKIIGIDQTDAERGDEELLNALINQNSLGETCAGCDIKIIHKYKNMKTATIIWIVGMTETHTTDVILDDELNIKGYNMCRCDSQNKRTGGVILYVDTMISSELVAKVTIPGNLWMEDIYIKPVQHETVIAFRNFSNIDYNILTELLRGMKECNNNQGLSIDVKDHLNKIARWFTSSLSGIADKVAPIKKIKIPAKWLHNRWFTPAILKEVKLRDSLYKKAVRSKRKEDFDIFRKKRNQVVTLIRKSKIDYINRKIEGNRCNPRELWRELKNGFINKRPNTETNSSIIFPDNKVYTTDRVITEKFNEYFLHSSKEIDQSIKDPNCGIKALDYIREYMNIDNYDSYVCLDKFEVVTLQKLNVITKKLEHGIFPDD